MRDGTSHFSMDKFKTIQYIKLLYTVMNVEKGFATEHGIVLVVTRILEMGDKAAAYRLV